MPQYTTGTVTVSASQIVTGSGTAWLSAGLLAGDPFIVTTDGVPYYVANVDTDLQLSLSAPYAGTPAAGLAYVVGGQFTPNLNIPYPERNDIEIAATMKRALLLVDALDVSFTYHAWASDDAGTGFTLTFDALLDYQAILRSPTEIAVPVVGDFAGLWKNVRGPQGIQGIQGEIGPAWDQWQGAWLTATGYVAKDAVSNGGSSYICISAHTSGATSEPGVGASWQTYWDIVAAAGTASAADISGAIHAATSKTTPVDADEFGGADSEATFGLKKFTWANIKATLKTYFDTLYASLTGATYTGLVTFAAGANIASAATIDLTAATGNSPRITGTTPTSAVTMNTGQQMLVVADGAWPLTYHATTNKIITGANYTCSAGDIIIFHKDLSGIVHAIPLSRVTGDSSKNFTANNLTLLGTTLTVGNQASWKEVINGTSSNRNWQIDLAALTASGYLGITPSTANGGTTFTTPLVQISDGTVTELGLIVNGSIRPLSTAGIRGTVTNDSVDAGGVGEIVSSAVSSISAPTSTQFGDLTSISLTAGDWMISCCATAAISGATMTGSCIIGIGTATGNNSAGLVFGDTRLDFAPPTAISSNSISIPSVQKKLAGSATIYLKMYADYSAGTPNFSGRITAQRIR